MTDQKSTPSDPKEPAARSKPDDGGAARPLRRQRRRRILRLVAVSLLLLIVGGGGTVFYLLRSPPTHWQKHQAFLRSTSPQELNAIATRVDDRMGSLIALAEQLEEGQLQNLLAEADEQNVPGQQALATLPGQPASTAAPAKPLIKKIHMTPQEANAWISQKLDEWLRYRDYEMPDQVADPMIAIDDNRLLLSFAFESSGFSQVFTAGFDLTFLKNGKASLELRDVTAGQLPLPVDGIGNYIRSKAPGNATAKRVATWLDKLDGVEFKPSMKLGKKHKVWVIAYDVTEDGIDLTVKVQKRPGYGPAPKKQQTQVAVAE